jgi:hypothetical protein
VVRLIPAILAALTASCATDIGRVGEPVVLGAVREEHVLLLTTEVRPELDGVRLSGPLRPGQVWHAAGDLPEGTAYRCAEAALQVNARHVHEAWIVVREGWLVALYLPVEGLLLTLESPRQLPLAPNP